MQVWMTADGANAGHAPRKTWNILRGSGTFLEAGSGGIPTCAGGTLWVLDQRSAKTTDRMTRGGADRNNLNNLFPFKIRERIC